MVVDAEQIVKEHSTKPQMHIPSNTARAVSRLSHRLYSSQSPKQSTHRPGGRGERMPIIPFVAILVGTSGTYMLMVRQRANQAVVPEHSQTSTARYRRNT